ncbi:hypothetical protein [Baekduia sp. Peel2402]|uniref:hypothetical protein n=1 Tax=Baekduia sp. Peel2402 TaxID=3458296 RepID=UPI00403E6997
MNQRLRTTLVSLGILSDPEAEARQRAERAENTLAEDLRDLAVGVVSLALGLGLVVLASLALGRHLDAEDAATIGAILAGALFLKGGAIAWRRWRPNERREP